MSANFNALTTSLLSRAGAAGGTDFPGGLSAGDTSGPDGLHFADWMAQHRDMQRPSMALPNQPAPAASSAPKSPSPQQHPPTVAKVAESRSPSPADKPKASQAPAKAADAPSGNANASAKCAKTSGEKASSDDADESDEGREVTFKTAQGEASTWVQELQPPEELATSDPAAMLAWLGSLTQADTNPVQKGAALGGNATAGAKAKDAAADLGKGQEALASDTLSLATSASGKDAGAAAAGKGAGAKDGPGMAGSGMGGKDALALAATGPGAQAEAVQRSGQDADKAAIDFSAVMSREVGRNLQAAKGPEAARHYTGTLTTPVESPQFAQALSDRVGLWISGAAASGPMTAELRLNPAEMGPVHIRIELDGQNAMVDFAAANAQTREAIESSLPALSGALQEIGLSLSGGGVSDQNAGQAWAGQQDGKGRSGPPSGTNERIGTSDAIESDPARRPAPVASQRAGGLDLYA